MANPITQYFKDTRSELNHVAWPTQRQTVVFTALVAAISLGIAAYLGAFDYAFTTALSTSSTRRQRNASSGIQVTQQPASSATQTTHDKLRPATGPTFTIPGTTPSSNSTQ